jgi:hypothetical protein
MYRSFSTARGGTCGICRARAQSTLFGNTAVMGVSMKVRFDLDNRYSGLVKPLSHRTPITDKFPALEPPKPRREVSRVLSRKQAGQRETSRARRAHGADAVARAQLSVIGIPY